MTATVLGVAGVGLIGGSIALRAKAAGMRVIGFDRDPEAIAAARIAGAIDESVETLAALAQACAVVAVALPVDVTEAVLASTPELGEPELVFDVASIKAPIVRAAGGLRNFVASHPLAGRETGGFGAADQTLFEGRTWAVVPSDNGAAQLQLEALIVAFGATPLVVDADAHDRLVAVSSHLPQVLSVILGTQLGETAASDPPGVRTLRTGNDDNVASRPLQRGAVGTNCAGQRFRLGGGHPSRRTSPWRNGNGARSRNRRVPSYLVRRRASRDCGIGRVGRHPFLIAFT